PVVYTESANGSEFFINGKQFDENRVDEHVKLGDVEEWTITNATGELHTFHIHQLGFQVTEINGVAQPFYGYQDNINVPHATRQRRRVDDGELKDVKFVLRRRCHREAIHRSSQKRAVMDRFAARSEIPLSRGLRSET